MFIVIDDELYKRNPSETGILMKCIPIAPRSLVGKAFRQEFYWPTALRNAEDIVRA